MSTVSTYFRPLPFPSAHQFRGDPGAQAYFMLRLGFFLLPLIFGIDKFAGVLTDDWPKYLATFYNDILPGSGQTGMYIIGVVEIAAAFVVLFIPRFGGLLVAAWLAGIILSLLLVGGYGDVALRDFGLLLAAISMSRLAARYARGGSNEVNLN